MGSYTPAMNVTAQLADLAIRHIILVYVLPKNRSTVICMAAEETDKRRNRMEEYHVNWGVCVRARRMSRRPPQIDITAVTVLPAYFDTHEGS